MRSQLRFSIILIVVVLILSENGSTAARKGKRKQKDRSNKQDSGGDDKAKAGGGGGKSDDKSLKQDKAIKSVLRNMGKVSKPLRLPPSLSNNSRVPVTVVVDFGLSSVSEVNAEGGFVDLEGLLTMMWRDRRLEFTLPKYSDEIRTVHVDPKTIWTPDLQLYNAMAPGLQTVTIDPMAVVSRSGDVFLSQQVKLRTACDVVGQLTHSNMLNCTVKLGSWTYNGFDLQLNVSFPSVDKLRDYQVTGLWSAVSATAWDGGDQYACCPETFPYVRFSFVMRKRIVEGIPMDH